MRCIMIMGLQLLAIKLMDYYYHIFLQIAFLLQFQQKSWHVHILKQTQIVCLESVLLVRIGKIFYGKCKPLRRWEGTYRAQRHEVPNEKFEVKLTRPCMYIRTYVVKPWTENN